MTHTDHTYWHQQNTNKPLFPDIEWSKPEQRTQRGRLGLIGGNKLGFAGVAESYRTALETGAGEVRVLLPDTLCKTIPTVMTDVVFSTSNPSGGIARGALIDMLALAHYSNVVLLCGDAGRNSETAITYEDLVTQYSGKLVITRDAVDLLSNNYSILVNRPDTAFVVSFAQLQKLFQGVYYPKVLTFSMQLLQLVEALHKFTHTYPVAITVLHRDTLVIAHNGEIVTTPWNNPMAIWRGHTAARAATYWIWNPTQPLKAIATSVAAE
ncbi:hypothetical protein EOL96_02160 [Candidatus Saccharibacteria bacterium]|nr:hypothetical protein [Candidatus Saccharibacteria bacterium]